MANPAIVQAARQTRRHNMQPWLPATPKMMIESATVGVVDNGRNVASVILNDEDAPVVPGVPLMQSAYAGDSPLRAGDVVDILWIGNTPRLMGKKAKPNPPVTFGG